MSRLVKYMIAAMLTIALAIPTGMSIVKANKIPTFDIVSVVPDEVVTIQTYDFPAGKTFDVLIGRYGSYGIRGINVATQGSEKGGTFTATYKIPEEFKGVAMLSIRLEDKETGYYAYNWFENRETPVVEITKTGSTTVSTTPIPVEEVKHPSFIISSVDADKSFSVIGNDFPENKNYDVIMGVYGTFGIGGEKVTVQKTGVKGEFKSTYTIPADLKGAYMIAVRLESADSDYFAFNYFYNATYVPVADVTEVTTTAAKPTTTVESKASPTAESSYQGYPYFSVTQVKKDTSVMIEADNLPADEVFDVYLNDFDGASSDAIKAGTLNSGKGGKASGVFTIPTDLKGIHQISIRLSGQKTGYFAYNYFFNADFPVVVTVAPTEAAASTTAAAPETTPAPAVEASPTKAFEPTKAVEPTTASTPETGPQATPTVQ